MNTGRKQTKINGIIVKEVARNWQSGDKVVNKVLRRYGVTPDEMEAYRAAGREYHDKHYT